MPDFRVKLNPYQEGFLLSRARYPGMIAGVGTGKTMMLLGKIWRICEKYPDSLTLIVRKEFTDLRDSTIKDFTTYFGVGIDSDKNYTFPNGSQMMFRHGAELSVLKNINLTAFGIEQAEEFDTAEQFIFLRDRLRRKNAPFRQGIVIANACGHNWIWTLWIYKPGKNYEAFQATTFDNAHNLPDDFVEDLREMERDAPNHYAQFVMNSHEVLESADLILSSEDIDIAMAVESAGMGSPGGTVLSLDVARFGDDVNVASAIEARGSHRFEQTLAEEWGGVDTMQTTGRFVDLVHRIRPTASIIDGDGLGAGVVDRVRELKIPVIEFRGGMKARLKTKYVNRRSEGFLETADLIKRAWLKPLNKDEIKNQLLSIRFSFDSKGRKKIESKDDMRKRGLKSPNYADSLMMANAIRNRVSSGFKGRVYTLPRVSKGYKGSFFNEGRRTRLLQKFNR